TTYTELGPDTTLTTLTHNTHDDTTAVSLLRPGQPEAQQVVTAVAQLHARGVRVDWEAYFAGSGAQPAELPTYAFQHERYWLEATAQAADAAGLGLSPTGHPVLGASLELADGDQTLFTSRLSLQTHPWLADHTVLGTALLPGTGFVELAVRAGEQVGCDRIEELTLSAPLILPERGGVQVQLVVGEADDSGARSIAVHSRPDGDGTEGRPWTLNAKGVLAPGAPAGDTGTDTSALVAWPPAGASEIALDGVYERLAEQDYGYGPAFQGLHRVWRGSAGEMFAEVRLPESARSEAGRFVLHPALLDAALHPLLPGVVDEDRAALLPFSWSGVRVHASGASVLRVRLTLSGPEEAALTVADGTGAPVATVESLSLRPLSKEALLEAGNTLRDGLFRIAWTPVDPGGATPADAGAWAVVGDLDVAGVTRSYAGLDALAEAVSDGADVPRTVLLAVAAGGGEVPGAAHDAVQDMLRTVQGWLADERFTDTTLVIATRGAVTTSTQ
ncbi:polyketide synthase dehydratase domain-containing protein, partial [Streptomyces sp. NPDC058646]|uniref:polyketide synthase dehydratase domain-containing protein n=1 Tax=Streptomyces sp. NPDC058646 TaxID=3346574 RepID=UPI00365BA5FE